MYTRNVSFQVSPSFGSEGAAAAAEDNGINMMVHVCSKLVFQEMLIALDTVYLGLSVPCQVGIEVEWIFDFQAGVALDTSHMHGLGVLGMFTMQMFIEIFELDESSITHRTDAAMLYLIVFRHVFY